MTDSSEINELRKSNQELLRTLIEACAIIWLHDLDHPKLEEYREIIRKHRRRNENTISED